MDQITGLWKGKTKAGKPYYKSAKINKEMIEVLKKAKDGDTFLIFEVDKGDNENRPDIHLCLAEDSAKE